jgi:tRNA pseudouridine55 synthase
VPPKALSPTGLVLVDKPAGPSSFAIVKRLRDRTGARAGHAGTLDPFATGLLLVLLGSSTRLAQYLVGLDKRYLTDVDLSSTTSTGDVEGDPVEHHDPPASGELEQRLAPLTGEIILRVPAASAVKVEGERAYRRFRAGQELEMPYRTSTVHELRLHGYEEGVATLELHVSSGTYVRAVADELGGHCRTLRRTAVGPFSVDDADEERILPPADALPFLPAIDLTPDEADEIRAGRRRIEQPVRAMCEGRLVAVDGTVLP